MDWKKDRWYKGQVLNTNGIMDDWYKGRVVKRVGWGEDRCYKRLAVERTVGIKNGLWRGQVL